jgi:hypothetical protein
MVKTRRRRRRSRKQYKKNKRRNTRRKLVNLHQKGGGMLDFFNVFKKAEKKDDPNKKIDAVNKGFLGMFENKITGLFNKQQAQLEATRTSILSQVKSAVNTASSEAKKAVGMKKTGGLTYEFLEKTLTKYFKGDASKASEVIAFIKSNEVGNEEADKEKEENKQLKNLIDDISPGSKKEKKEEKKEETNVPEEENKQEKKLDNIDDKPNEDDTISVEEVNIELDEKNLN